MKKKRQFRENQEEKIDAFIRKKMMGAADELEQKLYADPALRQVRVTDAMRADILRRIGNEGSNTISFVEWKHTHAGRGAAQKRIQEARRREEKRLCKGRRRLTHRKTSRPVEGER